jgi:hypothetical protein
MRAYLTRRLMRWRPRRDAWQSGGVTNTRARLCELFVQRVKVVFGGMRCCNGDAASAFPLHRSGSDARRHQLGGGPRPPTRKAAVMGAPGPPTIGHVEHDKIPTICRGRVPWSTNCLAAAQRNVSLVTLSPSLPPELCLLLPTAMTMMMMLDNPYDHRTKCNGYRLGSRQGTVAARRRC